LRAAEQAGNLAYVLEELSRALLRRLDHRVSWWTSVIAPLGTAFLGCGVGFTAIGMILPLISLIQGLSGG
jgi:type II secretory pathway component PulF